MQYKIYYKIIGVDLEYRYATTVKKSLLQRAIIECFAEEEVLLLIIAYNQIQDCSIPVFFGTNRQYLASCEHTKKGK